MNSKGKICLLLHTNKLFWYKNRFPGLPEAIRAVSKPFWVISGNIYVSFFVDHFWDQSPTILDLFLQFMGPKVRTGVCIYDLVIDLSRLKNELLPDTSSSTLISNSGMKSKVWLTGWKSIHICFAIFFWLPAVYGPGIHGYLWTRYLWVSVDQIYEDIWWPDIYEYLWLFLLPEAKAVANFLIASLVLYYFQGHFWRFRVCFGH